MGLEIREVRCKYCSWSVPAIYKNKKGRTINGLNALREHVSAKHSLVTVLIAEQQMEDTQKISSLRSAV